MPTRIQGPNKSLLEPVQPILICLSEKKNIYVSNCQYQKGSCQLRNMAAAIWTSNKNEICQYIPFIPVNRTALHNNFLSSDFTMALLYDNSSFLDCGSNDLKKSHQGIVFRITNQSQLTYLLKTPPSPHSRPKCQTPTSNIYFNQQIITLRKPFYPYRKKVSLGNFTILYSTPINIEIGILSAYYSLTYVSQRNRAIII